MQSPHRKLHSTKTALLCIRNDILTNMNSQHVALLVFLDLSAAFDTTDHAKFLQQLEYKFGFIGTTLEWFRSYMYLADRFQQMIIDGARSAKFDIPFDVPQGSCLGPLLFSIIRANSLILLPNIFLLCTVTPTTQLYLAFGPGDHVTEDSAAAAMEACIRDIRRWMVKTNLSLMVPSLNST